MATQLKFTALLKEMKAKRTTNGYDILVSYSEEKVNQLLQARSRDLSSILSIGPLKISGETVFGGEFNYSLSMKLNHPLLQFEDDHGNITLTFGIEEGKVKDLDKDKENHLPSNLQLSFKTTLTNVTGTVEGGFAKPGAKTTPTNRTVILNPDEEDVAQGVCITFQKSTLDIISTTGDNTTAYAILKDGLQKYFQDNADLKYYVAGISNQYNPESESHPLRPHSFSFAAYSGKTKDDTSVLCMQIQVAQGTGEKAISMNDNSWNLFGTSGFVPIPRGSTCSIIIQGDLLMNQLILPSLRNAFDNMEDNTSSTEGGFTITGAMKASDVVIPEMHKEGQLSGGLGTKLVHVDSIQFSPSKPKTTIKFSSDINSKSNKVEYTSDRQRARWRETISADGRAGATLYWTNLEFSWTSKGSWKDKSNVDHPNLLGFDWIGDQHYKVNKSAEDHGWWNWFFGNNTSLPEPFKNLKVPRPELKMEMKTLDYFLTTNLLYPGKHIFKADDPTSESTEKGLALPHDLILTGQTLTS
ncbi:hypothetical protein N7463_001250 [Penicillium fimorum]|uniref:Uncharacterized protein n=1 Tax=Penicillium fimorum TaxID=1882269 RepID=A0A9X0CCG3_9EURO|nr:hypothetical protein N7463_001250 [Penicillium fimorum]